ncbi:MAG: cation transporter dimerization domain-containing protein [Bacteroidales bacterium]
MKNIPSDKDNVKPYNFLIHNYINHIELTFHIRLDENMDIRSGHRIATDIENRISDEFNISATIHIEPMNRQ